MNFKAIQLSFLFNPLNLLNRPVVQPKIVTNDIDLFRIWEKLVFDFFPEKSELLNYKLKWSKRPQKRVLASCNIVRRIVKVAPAMQMPESQIHLEALIFHELCHAVAGISIKNGRRDIHSKSFKALEALHPGIKELDLWIKSGGWINAVRKSTRKINREKLLRKAL